jgi:hypothetical protein
LSKRAKRRKHWKQKSTLEQESEEKKHWKEKSTLKQERALNEEEVSKNRAKQVIRGKKIMYILVIIT